MKKTTLIVSLAAVAALVILVITFGFSGNTQADNRRYPEDFRIRISVQKETKTSRHLIVNPTGEISTVAGRYAWLATFLKPDKDGALATLSTDEMNHLYDSITESGLTRVKDKYENHNVYGGTSLTIDITADGRQWRTYNYERDIPEINSFIKSLNLSLPKDLQVDWKS